jgi:hypothetical protein
LVLVAKHPGVRYLLPVAATLPLLFATALEGLKVQRQATRQALTAFSLVVLAGFGASLWSAVSAHLEFVHGLQGRDVATESTLVQLAQERGIARDSLRALWTYGTTSPCYALAFGDDYANRAFYADIASICPHDSNLNIWDAKVAAGLDDIDLTDYPEWDVIVVPGELAAQLPQSLAISDSHASSIDSLGYGPLIFVARK